MNESDIVLLIGYVSMAPQRYRHVPGRGDMEPADEYQLLVSKEQRDAIVNALRQYRAN